MKFTQEDIEAIAGALDAEVKKSGDNFRLTISNEEAGRKISLEVNPDAQLGAERGSLVQVYTSNAFLQVQFCIGYIFSRMSGEVTFVTRHAGRVTGLVVEKEAGCSLYANIDEGAISGNYAKMSSEASIAAISLSFAEQLLAEGGGSIDADKILAEDMDDD